MYPRNFMSGYVTCVLFCEIKTETIDSQKFADSTISNLR